MKSFLSFSKQARARDLRASPSVRVDPVAAEGEQLHYSITDARRQSVIWTWP